MSVSKKIVPARLGKRDYNFDYHWKEIDTGTLKITKPTVLCFGGNRSFDNRDANAFCRRAEMLLNFNNNFSADDRKDIDLIGVSYGHFDDFINKKEPIETSCLTNSEIEDFSNTIFKPLYIDELGNKLSVKDAMKNFNLITTFTHSYGSIAINQIINKTYKDMIERGYTYEDTQEIFSQIVSVSYAPRGTISGATNIQIISGCDGYNMPLNSDKKTKNVYFSKFYNIENNQERGNGTMISDDNTISVFTTNMTTNPRTDDHALKVLIGAGYNSIRSSAHASSIFSIAQDSLILSIKNSLQNYRSDEFIPKPNLSELYKNTKQLLGKEQMDLERL